MKHSKLHLGCCFLPFGGIVFWVGGFVSLLFAWVSGGGFFWGRSSVEWYWDALVLGVLALGLKLGVIISHVHKSEHCEDGESEGEEKM